MWQGDDHSHRHCMHQSQVALAEGDLLHNCHSLYFHRNRDNENSSLPEKHEKHREKCNTTITLYYIWYMCPWFCRYMNPIWILDSYLQQNLLLNCRVTSTAYQKFPLWIGGDPIDPRQRRGTAAASNAPSIALGDHHRKVMSHEFKVQIKVFAPSLPPYPCFPFVRIIEVTTIKIKLRSQYLTITFAVKVWAKLWRTNNLYPDRMCTHAHTLAPN